MLEPEALAFPPEGLSAGLPMVSAGLPSISTPSSALDAFSFVSSETFGLALTLPSSLSRMPVPASPFKVTSPFLMASLVLLTMTASMSSVTLSAGICAIGQLMAGAVFASASTVMSTERPCRRCRMRNRRS